jgi:hypothetical protein
MIDSALIENQKELYQTSHFLMEFSLNHLGCSVLAHYCFY